MHKYILSLGTNMGERLNNLSSAVRHLSRRGELLSVSSVYETAPVEMDCQDPFLNCALHYRTYLEPLQMLNFGKLIEERMGRTGAPNISPRPIDIDLIQWSGGQWIDDRLTIPHARAQERAFVTVPVNEILPGTFPQETKDDQKIEHFCRGEILFLLQH